MARLAAFVCALLLAAPLAFADDAGTARDHYKKGTRLYELNHFAEAAAEYELAYQAKDDPALLFNIGQAYRFDGQNKKALLAYKQYLRKVPDARNRQDVEEHIAALEKLLDDEKRAASSPPTGTIPPNTTGAATPEPPHANEGATLTATASAPAKPIPAYKKWWVWTLVGVGAAAIAVGVGVGVSQSGSTPERTLPPIGGP